MELSTCRKYIKRTQKDYTILVVTEIEQVILTKVKQKRGKIFKKVGQSVNG